jgi:two-component system chemotaxis sensor kinase CheA
VIEVADDGAGLDTAMIGQMAAEKGLVTREGLAAMTPRQVQQLVFAPGFSTAQEVTALSGRGVGLDVVHSNLARIGGHADMAATPGKGTRFTLRIPLTLAILPALLVTVEGERYALPLAAVREVVRLTRRGKHVIERIGGAKVLRLRGTPVPVVSLQSLLGGDELAAKALNPFVAIISRRGGQFGIIVDDAGTAEEIVVKPLSPVLRGQSLFSGNAVLGDGGVAMILDPSGIADASGVDIGAESDAAAEAAQAMKGKVPMLVFRAGATCAIPLSAVARLEEFPAAAIEQAEGGRVARYRGGLLPLTPFHPAIKFSTKGRLPVLVLGEGAARIGLVVEEIMDIVEAPLDIVPRPESFPGLLGSAVVRGEVMEIADAAYFTGGRGA